MRGVDEGINSSDYCYNAMRPGHRQTSYENRLENIACAACRGDGGDFFRAGWKKFGAPDRIAVGGAVGEIGGSDGHRVDSTYGADHGSSGWIGSRGEPGGYYQIQWVQGGASKQEVKKKSMKASWNADKQAKAAAATNASDKVRLPQSSAEVKVSGSAVREPSALVRCETDAKASTSLNAEANLFVPGAWRHGA